MDLYLVIFWFSYRPINYVSIYLCILILNICTICVKEVHFDGIKKKCYNWKSYGMFTTITVYWYSGVKNGFILDKVGCMVNLFVLDKIRYFNSSNILIKINMKPKFSLLYFKKWIVNNFLNTTGKYKLILCSFWWNMMVMCCYYSHIIVILHYILSHVATYFLLLFSHKSLKLY